MALKLFGFLARWRPSDDMVFAARLSGLMQAGGAGQARPAVSPFRFVAARSV